MSENVRCSMDSDSDTMAPAIAQQNYDANVDYVINEYMDRLGTRLNILETELKYAWRALDLLSQEYIKMWERLEKLEGLLYEQQSVISQLLDFYTSGGTTVGRNMGPATAAMLEGRLGELEVIREILGNGTVEDGLEEGLDVTMPRDQSAEIQELELEAVMDEMHVPDEAFYRSLNQAYREDLVGCDPSCQGSQLGMIWEEREEIDENGEKKNDLKDQSMRQNDSQEIYSALDYKDYRGNSPCISEQDIAQLSRIDSIDHIAMEKLNELDRLSNKLHQDSVNIKHLQRKLLESPISVSGIQEEAIDEKEIVESANIDEKLQQMYPENWSFSSGVRDKEELMLLAKSDLPNSLSNVAYSTRPNSRLSVTDTDNEVAEALAGGIRTPTSPRRRQIEVTSCNAPFTTVTGRLAYSAAVQHVESAEAAAAAALAAQNPKNPFFCGNSDLNSLIAASYETVPCSTPSIFSIRSEKAPSPTLSICSIRTRQDGYIGTDGPQDVCPSSSPPPPAPRDVCEQFLLPNNTLSTSSASNVFLGTADAVQSSSISHEHGRLSPKPHSPKSPKTSPKRSKSHSSNIVAAKSDSGLSSMSGWSSLEKSPGSPKNGNSKAALNYYSDIRHYNNRPLSPSPPPVQPNSASLNSKPFTESSVDSKINHPTQISANFLPGGHHLSAFTTVKSPCSLENVDGYGNFVPAPAPASDINVSPRKKTEHQPAREKPERMYRNDQPAIYSVAGSNRESYTSVYTSNSADYISQTINYPDLVEPYENNEFINAQQKHFYNSLASMPHTGPTMDATPPRRRSLSRSYSTNKAPESIANHEGYKTAMYRTMFPSGNITDALSYYPTSSRYDSALANLPQGDYNDPSIWLNCPSEGQFHDSASTSSSMRSVETSDTGYTQSPYMDRRHQHHQQHHQQHQNIQQPIYENQQQIEQHKQWSQRQEIPYLELDLRNRNVPEYVVQQQHVPNKYYDPSGVIMTQSGYITISSGNDYSQHPREEKTKKMKRGSTLKSAMTSVSHWLPDLHLTKRHRSYSLPSGSKKDETETRNTNVKSNVTTRKKKKNAIVSTVSGILQKAKRKSHSQHLTQSLSDPEQSENEWTLNRTRSVVSEDDRSEDSSSVFSENQFERDLFPKITATKKPTTQAEQKSDDDSQLQPLFETIPYPDKTTTRTDTETENGFAEEEHSGKSTDSVSSNIFPTIGDVKRSSGSSEKSDETIITDNKMVVVVGGASMEFAVSRALGKYRQRHSNSMSDDQFNDEHGVVIEEIIDANEILIDENNSQQSEKLAEQKSTDSQNSSENNRPVVNDDSAISEGSPSTVSLRSQANRFPPRHQQSLEIPGHRDDDDSRSTHSWRSTSRVSSRRQSTEDSIDSEDEWYCYELRKLEEMERQTQLEQDMGATLHEEPEPPEEELYEPAEEVKEKMSFVLRELRMKAKVVEGVLDAKDNNLHVIQSAKRRGSNRGSFQLDNAASLFEKIKHYHHDDDYQDEELEIPQKEPEVEYPKDDEDRSSGETSGPDSPHHSTDEYDENEMMLNEEFARFHLDNEMGTPIERGQEAVETPTAVQIPKIKVDSSTAPQKDEQPKEGGQLGSKWKLLKTLKERKAEEKNNQGKAPIEPPVEKDKNGSGIGGDSAGRANGHPGDNPFYSNIDSMPDIRPRRKSIPLVSDLKPPLKREDSFLQRFSTRQIPEAQETVEDTGSEGGDNQSAPRRRRRQRKQPKTVVNPDSNFYFYWLLVLTICILYNLWTLIVRQSFPELQEMMTRFWLTCDSLSDLIFLLDLVVQLRTGYLEQGLMVYDSKKLACHYLRSRAFLLDLAALCPLDLLQFRFGWNPLLRCPRFLKVYRAVNYYYMVESRTVWPNLWRVINLIHILLILAHWFGCFYFLLSEAEGFQGDWVYPYRPGDYATLTRKYLGSLYWSTLTLTTIGDLPTPETNAEKTNSVDGPRSLPRRGVKSRLLQFNTNHGYIFTIVSYLIGVFIFATIVGQVGNVITNRNANRLEFERLLDGAKTYMRHHKVPGGMKRRVLRWYDYSWSRGRIQGGGDINTALGLLPDKLKTELALHVNLSVLKKVTIFQECQPEFLRDLVLKMKAYIFTPGDSICRKGEVAREMFIIADGILEVLSEHGKVLTTMKAGDFFGEIGILNLDGLNKRTADVRSVGYSELFSLSREDVLAAMKDYPEAQEILQALGRKRLMEVKASARHPPHHKEHHVGHPGQDGKGLVDKIKNEAKGLRNALKKTRTHRRSQESLELQPLHTPANKATLKRMSRVKSHDLSQEENEKKEQGASDPVISPIGAGLPLLHRLKLLKEKQDNEERSKSVTPTVSPTSCTMKSPPPISEDDTGELIGAGLPLLQRILMLKAKEEKAAKAAKTGVGGTKSVTSQLFSGIGLNKGTSSSQPSFQISSTTARASFSGPAKSTLTLVGTKTSVPAKLLNNKMSLKDRIKLATSAKEKDSSIKDSLLKDSDPPSITDTTLKLVPCQPSNNNQLLSSSIASGVTTQTSLISNVSVGNRISDNFSLHLKTSSDSVDSVDKNEPHWIKLKRAAISKDVIDSSAFVPSKESCECETVQETTLEATPKEQKPKPSLFLTRKTKHYRSIDDLSPEYGPLPFVKKLKILNERQKLEELETVMKTRSFSLDIPDNQSIDGDTLTRSHSEGSTVHQDKNLLTTPLTSSPLHSSNESNETIERRNLKSILKKLSEDTKEKELKETAMPEKIDSTEFRRLMRAPTIEGYAARHSKLSKSVTFNRDTLQSPPSSATIAEAPQNLFPVVNSSADNTLDVREQEKQAELESCGVQIVSNKANNQVKLIKGFLDDEQQYFTDILLAIKQVMSSHLQDMQEKYQQKFEKLEEELKSKDEVITQLKAHICELEKVTEDSFTTSDSLDTVISKEKQSWEEPTHEEQEELQELPRPIKTWSSPPHNVVLDIDSTTDTESDIGETSEADQTDCESGEYENSSSNWEIELLAAQIRQRRSASLDHTVGRPLRKRFTKGSSMDLNND